MKVLEDIKKYCWVAITCPFLAHKVGILCAPCIYLVIGYYAAWARCQCRQGVHVCQCLRTFLVTDCLHGELLCAGSLSLWSKNKIKHWAFWIINLLFIVLWNHHIFSIYNADLPNAPIRIGFYQFGVMWMILNYAMVVAAIFVRYYIRHSTLRRQLREEKQKMTEAELAWLKNQLNPHFLFNTLNNIASLTQTSPNNAQKAIGQLSELLRYALYETQPKEVSLNGEIAFIKNYINLMTLRSGSNVEIKSQFIIHNYTNYSLRHWYS